MGGINVIKSPQNKTKKLRDNISNKTKKLRDNISNKTKKSRRQDNKNLRKIH